MPDLPKIVIGVPGKWTGIEDIKSSIRANAGGYMPVGSWLIHHEDDFTCELEIYKHDPDMRKAFEVAGGGQFSKTELQAIEAHTHTLYIIDEGGSFPAALAMMRTASALLNCGGIAAKVESSGLAHPANRWRELAEKGSRYEIYRALVVTIGDGSDDTYYSSGMHNFGLKDVTVSADITPQETHELMEDFLLYLVLEEPEIKDKQTFSRNADAPRYVIRHMPSTEFPKDHLFYNPYGMWSLSPALSNN